MRVQEILTPEVIQTHVTNLRQTRTKPFRHLRMSLLVNTPKSLYPIITSNNNSLASAFDRGCCNPKNHGVFHDAVMAICCADNDVDGILFHPDDRASVSIYAFPEHSLGTRIIEIVADCFV